MARTGFQSRLSDSLSRWTTAPTQNANVKWRVIEQGVDAAGARIVCYDDDMNVIGYAKLVV